MLWKTAGGCLQKKKREERKMRKIIAVTGILAVMAGAMVSLGATKQVIRLDETKASQEASVTSETEEKSSEAAAEDSEGSQEGVAAALEPVKMWGQVISVEEGSFSFERQFAEGGSEEVIVHIDPNQTLILDVDGYPAGQDSIKKGEMIYVYAGPAMALSLPPQTTAVMAFTGIRQDAKVPEYATAAAPLAEDGQGGFLFTSLDGREFKVPAGCTIIPYLTRQMVRLEDIREGSRCLLWSGADGIVEKIVLFNEE